MKHACEHFCRRCWCIGRVSIFPYFTSIICFINWDVFLQLTTNFIQFQSALIPIMYFVGPSSSFTITSETWDQYGYIDPRETSCFSVNTLSLIWNCMAILMAFERWLLGGHRFCARKQPFMKSHRPTFNSLLISDQRENYAGGKWNIRMTAHWRQYYSIVGLWTQWK